MDTAATRPTVKGTTFHYLKKAWLSLPPPLQHTSNDASASVLESQDWDLRLKTLCIYLGVSPNELGCNRSNIACAFMYSLKQIHVYATVILLVLKVPHNFFRSMEEALLTWWCHPMWHYASGLADSDIIHSSSQLTKWHAVLSVTDSEICLLASVLSVLHP